MSYSFNNTLGKFEYNNHYFNGTINKKGSSYEFTVIDREFESDDDFILINGTLNHENISLILINNPIRSKRSNYIEETFLVQFLFIGYIFNEINELKFKDIHLKINNISSTLNLHSFNFTYEERQQKHQPLTIEPVKGYYVELNDLNIEIKLNSYQESMKLLGNGESINYSEDISVILHYNKPEDLNKISKDSIIIQNLFSFITGESFINEIYSNIDNIRVNMILPIVSDEKGQRYPAPIQLNEVNIEKIFKKWFENYENLNSIYDLFFSINPNYLNPASLFLTYARILESFHRQKYNGKYLSKSKFEKISKKVNKYLKKTDIIKGIENPEEKEKLLIKIKSSINYSYEFTLKDRLLELFKELTEYELFIFILNKYNDKDNLSDFCDIIKDNRNYYTHYGNKKENILEGVNLSELNESLRFIIILLFLKEFDLTSKEINDITQYKKIFTFKKYYSWI